MYASALNRAIVCLFFYLFSFLPKFQKGKLKYSLWWLFLGDFPPFLPIRNWPLCLWPHHCATHTCARSTAAEPCALHCAHPWLQWLFYSLYATQYSRRGLAQIGEVCLSLIIAGSVWVTGTSLGETNAVVTLGNLDDLNPPYPWWNDPSSVASRS